MTLPSNSSDNGNSLVLPNDVQLPPTVTPKMLDGRLRRAFLELTPTQMRDVLAEYDDAVNQKGEEIRNRAAYLFGVVKRYKVVHERAAQGGGEFTPQGNLSDRVQTRLDALISSGFCTASDVDAKIKDRMRMLPERDALDAIDEMNGCSRAEIRNFASYFMGIMNKYMKGERKDPRSRGANRARNLRDGQSNNKIDDRFSHYGRTDDQGISPRHRRDGRGDGRDRQSSMRDSDRDHRSRRRSRSRSHSFDSRSRSRSPEYRRRRRSRSRSDSRDRHHSSRRHNRSTRDARTSSHRELNIPSTFGQNQPVMSHMIPPPPPQRPQNMMQPMTMGQQQLLPGQPPQVMIHGGLQRPMQPQQQFVQSIGQIPQLGQGTTDAQLQPFLQQYQQQLLQQQFQQSAPGSNIPQQTLQHMQQLQNYNQNMQQLNQANKMMPGSHTAGLTNMILGQQGPGSQPGNANNLHSLQNQNPDQPILDIFGLADKAAQALSAGRLSQVNPSAASVGSMSNPNFPSLLTPSTLSAPTYQPHQQNTSSSRQQNTATESDLPAMVKYAIQNLRTTGHIESTLDGPLIAMLLRLPENAALSALEIFSSCDLSKMRSKSAYLAGILKKELTKLGLQ